VPALAQFLFDGAGGGTPHLRTFVVTREDATNVHVCALVQPGGGAARAVCATSASPAYALLAAAVAWLAAAGDAPALQRRFSPLLAFVGDASLDFYLLQFHLWMAASATTVLAPVPGARWLSFAEHSLLLVVAAFLSSQAQAALCADIARAAWKAYAVAAAVAITLLVATLVWGRA
jgi:hypothetical protein